MNTALPAAACRLVRLSSLLCLAALAACAAGTAHLDRVPLDQEVEIAAFYWPYAALAAKVYASGGTVDRDAAVLAGSSWLRAEVADSTDPAVRQRLREQLRPAAANGAAHDPEDTPHDEDDCSSTRSGRPVPVGLDRAREEQRWEVVAELQRNVYPRGWSIHVPGLAIDVWRRPREADDGKPSFEYAIVYRGTQGPGGWVSNFRPLSAVTPFVWDQYHQALQATEDLVRQIRRLHTLGDVVLGRPQPTRVLITAVGHSLGGGLANYVLLRIPEITRVVNFDPSPVDGASLFTPGPVSDAEQAEGRHDRRWVTASRTQPFDSDERAPGVAIYSLYEKGEILTGLFGCHSGPLWGSEGGPVRLCEAVDLSRGSAVAQHDMDQLACKLYLVSHPPSAHAGE
jgi:hypothetical protein